MPTRRDTLRLMSVAGLSSTATAAGAADAPARLRTPLCDVLGIDHPLLQAPMQFVATPALVASVCEAGGMGILPGIGLPPDQLRANIQEVRRLTRRPFGVNLILHSALRPPVDMSTFPAETSRRIASVLNGFRARLGLPPRHETPPTLPDVLPALFEVIVAERVPLFSTGLGLPTAEMVKRCHDAGMKVMTMVATVKDAVEAAGLGVDVIAAQGSEAGGHRSVGVKPETPERAAVGGVALVPQVVRAVRVPVVAAGGIMDGRGLAAALALGASGVLMGTRFIATAESGAPPFYKDALKAGDSDDTTLSDAFTGHYARFLRNRYIEEYRSSGAPVFPPVVQQLAARDIVEAAGKKGDPSCYPMYAGQGVGAIDHVPPAADVVRAAVEEACQVIRGLGTLAASS
jgi:nitronate monooxygenase